MKHIAVCICFTIRNVKYTRLHVWTIPVRSTWVYYNSLGLLKAQKRGMECRGRKWRHSNNDVILLLWRHCCNCCCYGGEVWHKQREPKARSVQNEELALQWRIQGVSRASRHPPFCLGALFWKEHFENVSLRFLAEQGASWTRSRNYRNLVRDLTHQL